MEPFKRHDELEITLENESFISKLCINPSLVHYRISCHSLNGHEEEYHSVVNTAREYLRLHDLLITL